MNYSMTFSLAISIPTYKRNHQLLRTLRSIDDALATFHDFNVHIYIRDNDPASILESQLEGYRFGISYVRNNSNLGAGMNIIRSCGYADEDFVWCTGDDTTIDYLSFFNLVLECISERTKVIHLSSPLLRELNLSYLDTYENSAISTSIAASVSSSVFFHTKVYADESFLGRWIFRNDNCFHQALEYSLSTASDMHPYAFIGLYLIHKNNLVTILTSSPYKSGSDPDLKISDYRTLPRWPVGLAHLGAWRTGINPADYLLFSSVRDRYCFFQRQARYHLPIIYNAVLRDALGIVPCGLNLRDTLWIVLHSFLNLPCAFKASSLFILFLFRSFSPFALAVFTFGWLLSPSFRRIFLMYRKSMAPNCSLSFFSSLSFVLSRRSSFKILQTEKY